MITGKELWIDGLNEGIISHYKEQNNEDGTYIIGIQTKRKSSYTYENEADIVCYFSIENFVEVKFTDKKVIVKTYITR